MKKTIFLSLLLPLNLSFACEGFLPKNNLYLPLTEKNAGLGREEYDAVIDKFEKIYSSVVDEHYAALVLNRLWSSGVVNAGTFRDGKNWRINLYGGLARHREMTKDAYTLVLCHELGHHLGGAPKKIINRKTHWSSSEGQADYWASLKCFRRILEKEDNETIVQGLNVPEVVIEECTGNFRTTSDIALCKRAALAGQALAKVSIDARGGPGISFNTPDPNIVEQTYDKHPMPQCRLDTFFQGSICSLSWKRAVSQTDERKGTCHPWLGFDRGTRPLCWYRP